MASTKEPRCPSKSHARVLEKFTAMDGGLAFVPFCIALSGIRGIAFPPFLKSSTGERMPVSFVTALNLVPNLCDFAPGALVTNIGLFFSILDFGAD